MNKTFELFLYWDQMFFWMVHDRIKCSLFDRIFPWVTHLGSTQSTVLCTLSILIIDYKPELSWWNNLGVQTAIGLAISHSLIHVIKRLTERPRPYDALTQVHQFQINLHDYSFPSGHTAASVTVAVSICSLFPELLSLLIGISGLVGLSRIYLGVHYPTDVLVGALIGGITGLLVLQI
jgi:undecaprenyl-diphosphatase